MKAYDSDLIETGMQTSKLSEGERILIFDVITLLREEGALSLQECCLINQNFPEFTDMEESE